MTHKEAISKMAELYKTRMDHLTIVEAMRSALRSHGGRASRMQDVHRTDLQPVMDEIYRLLAIDVKKPKDTLTCQLVEWFETHKAHCEHNACHEMENIINEVASIEMGRNGMKAWRAARNGHPKQNDINLPIKA